MELRPQCWRSLAGATFVSPATCPGHERGDSCRGLHTRMPKCVHTHGEPVCCVSCVGMMLSSATLCSGPVCHVNWTDRDHYPHFAGGETETRKGLFVGLRSLGWPALGSGLEFEVRPPSPLSGSMCDPTPESFWNIRPGLLRDLRQRGPLPGAG